VVAAITAFLCRSEIASIIGGHSHGLYSVMVTIPVRKFRAPIALDNAGRWPAALIRPLSVLASRIPCCVYRYPV
jgi:hypothetical protein